MRPVTLRNAAVAFLAVTAASFFLIKVAQAVSYDDPVDSSSVHVQRVCFFVQDAWDYAAVKGEVCGYMQSSDGGVSTHWKNCTAKDMSGANLTAVQNMLTTQAAPLWLADQQ